MFTAQLTTSSNGQPSTVASDPTVLESGCSQDGSILYCSVVRTVTDDSVDGTLGDLNQAFTLKWAYGTASANQGISYHTARGSSAGTVNVVDTAVVPSGVSIPNVATATWAPTPAGDVDVVVTLLDTAGVDNLWVGVGFGEGGASMGPAEFYIGSVQNGVENRYLSGSAGNPALRSSSNVRAGAVCTQSGDALQCIFSRPLAASTSGGDSVSLEDPVFVRLAHGSLSGGGVPSQHQPGADARIVTADAQAVFNSSGGATIGGAGGNAMSYVLAGACCLCDVL